MNEFFDVNHPTTYLISEEVDLDAVLPSVISEMADRGLTVDVDAGLTHGDAAVGTQRYYTLTVEGCSTSGVTVLSLPVGKLVMMITAIASREDVDVAHSLLRAIASAYEGALDDESPLVPGAEEVLWRRNRDYMARLIEETEDQVMLPGFASPYLLSPSFLREHHPDADAAGLVEAAFADCAALQHTASTVDRFGYTVATDPDGHEHPVVFVSNRHAWGGQAGHPLLSMQGRAKATEWADLFHVTAGNPAFRHFDPYFFEMRPMPQSEWETLCEFLPGEMYPTTKTYLLRWNPAISSFTLDDYRALLRESDAFAYNWSVWDYKDVHEGDQFFMLREGDGENPGIVFRGVFTSEPYEGDDWAGTDRKRHYVDFECWDCADPDGVPCITLEQLQEALPDIDWTKGHSGELLSPETAEVLETIWEDNLSWIDDPDDPEAYDPDDTEGYDLTDADYDEDDEDDEEED